MRREQAFPPSRLTKPSAWALRLTVRRPWPTA